MDEGEKDHWDEDKYIKGKDVEHCRGSTDGGTTWVPLKVDADGKVIVVAA